MNNGRIAKIETTIFNNMKTQTILMTLGAIALTTITFNVSAGDVALSPRAKDAQIKIVSSTAGDKDLTASKSDVALSPRAADNQIKVAAGTANDVNPAAVCAKTMTGSPKAIQACSENPAMPGCKAVSVAPLK